ARKPGQKPGGADIGKEADTNLGHREGKAIAGDPVRSVDRDAGAAAHHDAVDQRNVWLAVVFDLRIEAVLVAPGAERLIVSAGAAERVESTQVAASGKGARARRGNDHPRHRRLVLPCGKLRRERMHHLVRDGVKYARPVEGDEASDAAALEQDVRIV